MAADREQRDKLMELMGEGSTRRIRLIIFAVLTLSGIAAPGVGVLVCSSDGRKRVGLLGNTGLGFRHWRLDSNRGLGPSTLAETPEGRAGRVGFGNIGHAQLDYPSTRDSMGTETARTGRDRESSAQGRGKVRL